MELYCDSIPPERMNGIPLLGFHLFIPAAVLIFVKYSCHASAECRCDLCFLRSRHTIFPALEHVACRMLMIYIAGSGRKHGIPDFSLKIQDFGNKVFCEM